MAKTSMGGYEDIVTRAVEGAFMQIGPEAVDIISNNLVDYSMDTGRLVSSITFTTDKVKAKMGPGAKETDALSQPKEPLTMYIGTGCPYAEYVEYGSPPHSQNSPANSAIQDGETFWDRIKAWAARHGIDEKGAYPIMMKIKEKGIRQQPFMTPAEQPIFALARMIMALEVKKLVDAIPSKKPIVVEVPITLTSTSARSK